MLKINDLWWAAGFLEGEGSFDCYKHSLRIRASQCQKEPLDLLQKIFGGAIYYTNKLHQKNPKWSPYWQWYLCGSKAAAVMITLFLLMSPKRKKQIKDSLDYWKIEKGRGKSYKTST